MTLLSTRNDTKRQPQLTRDAWIETALSVLVDEGIEAVQITHLSRRLGRHTRKLLLALQEQRGTSERTAATG